MRQWKKQRIALALSILMLFILMPAPVHAAGSVQDEYTWENGRTVNALDIDLNTNITISGTVTLNAPITIKSGTVNITGVNGGKLVRGASFTSGNMINIEGGLITLSNITLDGNKVSVSTIEHLGISMTGGSLTLGNGTTLQNHYVYDTPNYNSILTAGSAIRQTGGTITMMTGSSVTGNHAYGYGNIYVGKDASFTLAGGSVTNNDMSTSVAIRRGGGGGFHVVGKLTMTGGTISGNKASGNNSDNYGHSLS